MREVLGVWKSAPGFCAKGAARYLSPCGEIAYKGRYASRDAPGNCIHANAKEVS